MFRHLEPLDSKRHANLRYRPAQSYEFAKGLKAAPLSVSETVLAARDYPVVFTEGDEVLPMALLAANPEISPYIDDQGTWRGGYVPAHIRRYPFILGKTDSPDRHVLMIDKDSPQLTTEEDEGELLFVEGAIPENGVVARAQEFLVRFLREIEETRKFLQPLQDHSLLVPRNITVKRDGEEKVVLTGFRVVDVEALAKLDAETARAWLQSGLLGQVFAHLHSLNMINRLFSAAAGP